LKPFDDGDLAKENGDKGWKGAEKRALLTACGEERRSLPVGELLQHAANHGVHHQGQVSLLLRLLGFTPDNFDQS
jgi:uncharacterized damage-inducible protein DinB